MATLKIDLVVDDKGKLVLTGFGKEVDRVMWSAGNSVADFGKKVAIGVAGIATMGVAVGVAAAKFIEIADRYTLMEGKLKLVTSGTEQLSRVQEELYRTSLATHQGMGQTVDLYSGLARSTAELGISETRLLAITENMNKSFVVSSVSQEAAGNSMRQMTQAMYGGVVRAEEFNSIMENTPRVLQAVADGLGLTMGQLRQKMLDGKLTAQEFLEGFEKGSAGINAEFQKLPITVAQAMGDVKTVFENIVDGANDSSGATKGLAESIEKIAHTIDANRDSILSLFSGLVKGAELTVEGISNVIRSVQGLAIVAASESHSLKDWMMSDPADMKKWQDEILSGVSFYRDQLKKVSDEIAQVAKVREFEKGEGGWTAAAEERYTALTKERDAIQARIAAVESGTAVEDAAIAKALAGVQARIGGEVALAKAKTTTAATTAKVVKLETDERYQVLQMQKKALHEGEKEEEKAYLASAALIDDKLKAADAAYQTMSGFVKNYKLTEVERWKEATDQEIAELEKRSDGSQKYTDKLNDFKLAKHTEYLDRLQKEERRNLTEMQKEWNSFVSDTQGTLEGVLGSAMRREFGSIGEAWKAFCDGMVNNWIDAAARVSSQQITGTLFGTEATTTSAATSGVVTSAASSAWDSIAEWWASSEWADGGYVADHPAGGMIKAGSGTRDDVFLGMTGNTANFGMGGEFVVNKAATAKYYPLLEEINQRNFAAGGSVGGGVASRGPSRVFDRFADLVSAMQQAGMTADQARGYIIDMTRATSIQTAAIQDYIDAGGQMTGMTTADTQAKQENTAAKEDNTAATEKNSEATKGNTSAKDSPISGNHGLANFGINTVGSGVKGLTTATAMATLGPMLGMVVGKVLGVAIDKFTGMANAALESGIVSSEAITTASENAFGAMTAFSETATLADMAAAGLLGESAASLGDVSSGLADAAQGAFGDLSNAATGLSNAAQGAFGSVSFGAELTGIAASQTSSAAANLNSAASALGGAAGALGGAADSIGSFDSGYNDDGFGNYGGDLEGESTDPGGYGGGDYGGGNDPGAQGDPNGGGDFDGNMGQWASGGVVDRLVVPHGDDGLGFLKLGEGIVDTDTMAILSRQIRSGRFGGGDSAGLASQIAALREDLRAVLFAVAKNTQDSARILSRWTKTGMPPVATI